MHRTKSRANRAFGDVERQPEIGQYGAAPVGDHDVGRLHVTVDDTFPVRVVERGCHVPHDAEDGGLRQAFAFVGCFTQDVRQIAPFDKRHRHVVEVLEFAELVQGDDTRMAKTCDCSCLTLEAAAVIGCVRFGEQVVLDDLDSGVAIQAGIVAFVYTRHAAASEHFDDGVIADLSTDQGVLHKMSSRRKQVTMTVDYNDYSVRKRNLT